MRDTLVKYEAFSANLEGYSPQQTEHIAGRIIEKLSTPMWSSYYFDSDKVDGEVIESNRNVFAQSSAFKKYLADKGISSLDDITSKHSNWGLGSIFGFKQSNPVAMRDALVKYGVFSTNLEDYATEDAEHIVNNILRNL